MEQKKDIDYYMGLNWTLIEGQDTDFDGNPYYFIEIKEIPSFTFCAKTLARARENYKRQLKLSLQVMLEMGEHITEPGEDPPEDEWEHLCP